MLKRCKNCSKWEGKYYDLGVCRNEKSKKFNTATDGFEDLCTKFEKKKLVDYLAE